MKRDSIKETLSFKELTEDEKAARGILGRLYGPCADFINPTRNGRYYNDELWEKVFNENELVKEAFENGGIPGELDHPEGREDIVSKEIAIIMPEPPKRDQEGHLIAYFDILDTPNGRIAYQLAKYGYKLGISSRGTGDVIGDEVDPETYDFKCFDLVLTPSVKAARLSMTEGLDNKQIQLRKALTESLENSNPDDKKVMTETLDRLNIKLKEDVETRMYAVYSDKDEGPTMDEIKGAIDEIDSKIEDVKEQGDGCYSVYFKASKDNLFKVLDSLGIPYEDDSEYIVNEVLDDEELPDAIPEEPIVISTEPGDDVATVVEEPSEAPVEEPVEVEAEVKEESPYYSKIKEFLALVYDGDTAPTDEETEAFVQAFISLFPEECFNLDGCADKKESETSEETINEPEEANDEGSEVLVKSLQDALISKKESDSKVQQLQEQLAVSDTEVNRLKEENSRYKASAIALSEAARNEKDLKEKVSALEEELKIKDSKIQELADNKETSTKSLNESLSSKNNEISVLNEKLNTQRNSYESQIKQLNEKLEASKTESESKTKLVEQWKTFARKSIDSYINVQASMLGVRPEDIKNKLPKKYDVSDVDTICENLQTNSLNMKNLPFELGNKKEKIAKVQIVESKNDNLKVPSNYDDEVDSTLLGLAESFKNK